MELEVQGVYLFVLLLEVSKKLDLKLDKHLVLFTHLESLQCVSLSQVSYALYALDDTLSQTFDRPDHSSADSADQDKAQKELQRRENEKEREPELKGFFGEERPQAVDSFHNLIIAEEYVVLVHARLDFF